MSLLRLITQSLRFYWRTHLAVVLGVAVSTAVLVGALVVGDSVKYTLKTLSLLRLGEVQFALAPQNRYFRSALADNLDSAQDSVTAPVLQLSGTAASGDGTARVNRVRVMGVDERFWKLAKDQPSFAGLSGDEAVINEQLAARIGVKSGDDVLLRVEEPSLLPRDAPMAIGEDFSVALRMTVKSIASDAEFGRFSLQSNQIAPYNAFVPLDFLQEKLDLQGRANMLLMGGTGNAPISLSSANAALREHWEIADADLELRELPDRGVMELRTSRIFLDPPVVDAAKQAADGASGVLTYFVNEIRLGSRSTPYSTVAAVENASGIPDMGDDEIVINAWLADDLQAKSGDVLELTYFAFGPMRRLEERSGSFRVRAVLPMEGAAIDRELMPLFPGLAQVDNCRNWDPGVTIDLQKIRKKDEEYWNTYRGTPKGFVTLKAGQKMWGNRFGNLTALRYPLESGVKENIETAIKNRLEPASIGLFFYPVREQALAASSQSLDFGQLFLSLSFFLIMSALLLTGLLFVFGIEQRTEETGTMLALGFLPKQVRRIFLYEGGMLAVLGGISGAVLGLLYTKVVLYALSTVWHGAVWTAGFYYYARPISLIIGTLAGILISLLAIWITARRQAKQTARELLAAAGEFAPRSGKSGRKSGRKWKSSSGFIISAISFIAALAILGAVGSGRDTKSAAAFFGSGALLLIGCLGLSYSLLSILSRSSGTAHLTMNVMGLRNSTRRRGRSLATIALLACGGFLIIAIGANRLNPMRNADKRWSGTGGFALYGESTLPVLHDLNTEDGRRVFGLSENDMEGVGFVPFRVHDGEDATCLNLNRVQIPNLLGVRPESLQERKAFTFAKTADDSLKRNGWLMLKSDGEGDTVNAIGDENTIAWSVGKSVGDTIPYTDERGQTFYIRIVGAVSNSILQGGLIISEDEFVKRFPSESGYRMFLIDAPAEKASEVSARLTRAMQYSGLDLTPTATRLGDFNTIQNTYLSIFQTLGGLALILGSLGLGIVVLRNVMERRSELALMRAVGFRNNTLQQLILREHWLLLFIGLACGVISGLVAVIPALRSPGANIPYISLTITLFAVVLSGVLWTWIATRLALRGQLLNALRNE